MSEAPAFQFYANDFMDATRLWEANAVGLYARCLCIQWTHGSIPADLKLLARATHTDLDEVKSVWDVVGSKFELGNDGALRNKRLENVRERQKEISSKRSEAGKAGAIAKANASNLSQAKAKQRKVKEKVEGEHEEEGKERARTVRVEPRTAEERALRGAANDLPFGSPAFTEAVYRWEKHRKEKRQALTPSTREAWLKKCQTIGEARAIAAIDHSIEKGWTGMYEPGGNQLSATDLRKSTISPRDTPIELGPNQQKPALGKAS